MSRSRRSPKHLCLVCGKGYSNKAGLRRHQVELFDCEPPLAEGQIRCWCGAEGTYEDLFSSVGLRSTCGGSRYLDCLCGRRLWDGLHHEPGDQFDDGVPVWAYNLTPVTEATIR